MKIHREAFLSGLRKTPNRTTTQLKDEANYSPGARVECSLLHTHTHSGTTQSPNCQAKFISFYLVNQYTDAMGNSAVISYLHPMVKSSLLIFNLPIKHNTHYKQTQ